ncbi:MAG: superoxide dismutase [Cu-Zn] SodC [Neisseria sp.]|uniref:superoxide dismutase [Cu-Zn] SodC n=1 Tax=Neisseria sp. TaxID=192066 RepID=UPI0026DBA781|nr:superoxide dismutase [Cu-Zn] SodC [Neisseria sp.]MDO4640914.1 superoxide dismutase [Cu-Zn] SodC [Neisseria sp.]
MKKNLLTLVVSLSALLSVSMPASAKQAKPLEIRMHLLDPAKNNQDIGMVEVSQSAYGLVFTPKLSNLPAGLHGFHIHENYSCDAKEKDGKLVAGLGAGGHWDPKNTHRHGQPWEDDTHLGNLPVLIVNADGTANTPVLAPRLKRISQVKGHSLIIHVGGDNYSENPKPLGGGGARAACGLIN